MREITNNNFVLKSVFRWSHTPVLLKGVQVFKEIKPKKGDYVIIFSDLWYVFDNGKWREMTVNEQIEASK